MDVMLDLETLSLRPDGVVLEIAARAFTMNGLGEGFQVFVDITNQPGRHFDGETLMWWLQQSESARLWQTAGHYQSVHLNEALVQLGQWLCEHLGEDGRLWSKGELDIAVLKHAYHCDSRYGTEPWHYRQVREMRTWLDAKGKFPLSDTVLAVAKKYTETLLPASAMVEHRAADDCVRQICELWAAEAVV